MANDNPYRSQPKKAFWRSAVAGVHFSDMTEVSHPLSLTPADRIATAGSCFAQHLGRALRERGATYLDLEPAPAYLSPAEASENGFGIYSCRYGNLYTVRQLRQLVEEAMGTFVPEERVWQDGERFFDAMRPSVDPVGHKDAETVLRMRARHLAKVREMLERLDVFVFTLGLTEAWTSLDERTVYATCPGTVAGTFDPAKYKFKNFTYAEIVADFTAFHRILKQVNPKARMLLTVSPVSLAATASADHVLVANTYSKSTLRAVAGDLAATLDDIEYFPSYEIITTHANHGSFYDPDKRSVNHFGVNHVMTHFFRAVSFPAADGGKAAGDQPAGNNAIICDEEKLANEQAT
jgi:hypothetical protein